MSGAPAGLTAGAYTGGGPSGQALDDLHPDSIQVGWGSLGLNGDLGYEGQRVFVRGLPHIRCISTHPPARVVFSLEAGPTHFKSSVALNDSSHTGATFADFSVVADGRLAGAAWGVVAGGMPQILEADIKGCKTIELRVDSDQPEGCHAVWLEPTVESRPVGGPVADCLDRVEMYPPDNLPWVRRSVATVVTPGFADLLEGLLASLVANGGCPDSLVAVLVVDSDPSCIKVAERYGALAIPCRSRRHVNQSVKSALYSIARVVRADQYICLDADMLVLADLAPLFAAQEACCPGSLLACADQNRDSFKNLNEALVHLYRGQSADLTRFLGLELGESAYGLIVNDGAFAGDRVGMLSLDSCIRAMPGAAEWVDAHWLRNQFIFNLAFARMHRGIRMNDAYNLQLHAQDAQLTLRGGRVHARWRERPVSILHFNARGREKYARWRSLFDGDGRRADIADAS